MAQQEKSRKELLKEDDAFTLAAQESVEWAKSNRTLIIAGSVALLALIAGIWGFVEVRASRDAKASNLYLAASAIREAKIDAEKGDPSATPPTYKTEGERDKAARDGFQKVVDEASGSGVADLARFYAASLDEKLGDADKALAGFESLHATLSPTDNLYFLAVERSAFLREQKNDLDGAIAAWSKLLSQDKDKKKAFYGDRALYQVARLSKQKGDDAKVRELLAQLDKDYPGSAVHEQAENLQAQVGMGLPVNNDEPKDTP